jgi:hypothetical protein
MRHLARVTLFAALVSGCEVSDPLDLNQRRAVTLVEGSAPPRLVLATDGCDVTVRGGQLTFDAADQFDMSLDVFTDCIRGGGIAAAATYRYLGTADNLGPRVTFHVVRGGNPPDFEGVGVGTGPIQVTVPGLVPLVDEVSVTFGVE